MQRESTESLLSTSLVLSSNEQGQARWARSSEPTLLKIDYVDSQLIFQWELLNIPIENTAFVRHVFLFDVQNYPLNEVVECCEKLHRLMKLGDMFKVVYSDGSTGLNWTEKTLDPLNVKAFRAPKPVKLRLSRVLQKIFEKLGGFLESVSVAVFLRSADFLNPQQEIQLVNKKLNCGYRGLLSVFTEDMRMNYQHQDVWKLRQAYNLYEGCTLATINEQLSAYFYLLTKIRVISAELTVQSLDAMIELQSNRFKDWKQKGRTCSKRIYALNNFCKYEEKLRVSMVRLAGANLRVRFELLLLDQTRIAAERSFYIPKDNSCERVELETGTPPVLMPSTPFYSENRRYLSSERRLHETKIKLRMDFSHNDSEGEV